MGAAPLQRTRGWRGPLVAVASALLVATACTTPAASSPSPSASASVAPGAKRGDGGTLRIIYWQAPTILNGHQASGQKDVDAASLIFEPLAHWGPDAKPVAALAKEVPTIENGGVSKDFMTVTWKLKDNVKWSDGTDFTADDVVFTAQYMADEKTGDFNADYVTDTTVTAKDKYTILVTYKNPNPFYYQFGVGYATQILQKAQFNDCLGEK